MPSLGAESARTRCFFGRRRVQSLPQDLGLHGLLAEQALHLAQLALQGAVVGGRNDLSSEPAAVSAPCAASRRQLNTWFGATPWRRATKLTVTPGSYVSATIAIFSAAAQRRRRSGPCRTSPFALFPVIDTTLLLPLSQGGGRVRSIRGLVHKKGRRKAAFLCAPPSLRTRYSSVAAGSARRCSRSAAA